MIWGGGGGERVLGSWPILAGVPPPPPPPSSVTAVAVPQLVCFHVFPDMLFGSSLFRNTAFVSKHSPCFETWISPSQPQLVPKKYQVKAMSSQPLAVQGFVSFEQGRANLTLVPSTTTPTASSHNASFPCDAKEDLQDHSGKRDLRDHIMAQIRSGTITPHPSRMPLSARTLASQIAHAQVKTHIQPTGVCGAWNPEAEKKLIATLTRSLRYQKPQAIEDKKPDGKPQAIEDKKDENEEKHHAPAIENGAPTVVDSTPSAYTRRTITSRTRRPTSLWTTSLRMTPRILLLIPLRIPRPVRHQNRHRPCPSAPSRRSTNGKQSGRTCGIQRLASWVWLTTARVRSASKWQPSF